MTSTSIFKSYYESKISFFELQQLEWFCACKWALPSIDDLDNDFFSNQQGKDFWLSEDDSIDYGESKYLVVKAMPASQEQIVSEFISILANKKLVFADIDESMIGIFPENEKLNYQQFNDYIRAGRIKFIVGHNFINYDMEKLDGRSVNSCRIIDTLYVAFIALDKTFNSLEKIYKDGSESNNPILDAKECCGWFLDELKAFRCFSDDIQKTFAFLLADNKYYNGFFNYIGLADRDEYNNLAENVLIRYFENLDKIYYESKRARLELAFLLASKILDKPIPAYINRNHPKIKKLQMSMERETTALDLAINNWPDFKSFNNFSGMDLLTNTVSQEEIIHAGINDKNVLAVLPTGGGKSMCYQLPAIHDAKIYCALTIIISPLRSLMKEQVDSFNSKIVKDGDVVAGALSGYLSPSERNSLIVDVEEGKINLLYLAPEALRYKTILNLLKNRTIARIVVDEAHCLSTWGQDFRPDYRKIASFIKEHLSDQNIPISCFTATASTEVLNDIRKYFKEKLGIEFVEFVASNKRDNLKYKTIQIDTESEKTKDIKNQKRKELLKLISKDTVPAIIYIPNSIKECENVADWLVDELSRDSDFKVSPFHSKVDNKNEVLRQFLDNELDIIVATTAFGMGVDKPNIKTVIHYTPSSNIEDYLQESGRAGRDKNIVPLANCIALYHESDFDFYLKRLKTTMINRKEIQSVYQALKELRVNDYVKKSVLEIALKAGIDVDDKQSDYKTKINTILVELEEAGFIDFGINEVKPFASSIEVASADEARKKLELKDNETDKGKILAFDIYRLIQKKSRKQITVDEIVYLLGDENVEKADVVSAIYLLEQVGILGQSRDINLRITKPTSARQKTSERLLESYISKEEKLLDLLVETSTKIRLKDIATDKKELVEYESILRDWRSKSVKVSRLDRKESIWVVSAENVKEFTSLINQRIFIAGEIFSYIEQLPLDEQNIKVNLKKLKQHIENKGYIVSNKDIDRYLIYLQSSKALELLDGIFLHYTQLNIELKNIVPQYTNDDYQKRRGPYYINQRKKIHIMNEFLQKQIKQEPIEIFLSEYFKLPIDTFIKDILKYTKKFISGFVTKTTFEKIFKGLNEEQQKIISSEEKSIMILAGPGSGKTETLVHKMAYTLLNDEDVKPEQFLMLTKTRSAARNFREKLLEMIGEQAYEIDIFTFDAYALYLLGKNYVGNVYSEKYTPINELNTLIMWQGLELPKKSALFLDEYQDIEERSFLMIKNLINDGSKKDGIEKVLAVGDDDQMIMEFAGAHIEFFDKFRELLPGIKTTEYSLHTNYRSDKIIVGVAQRFAEKLTTRKKTTPLLSHSQVDGAIALYKNQSEYLYEPVVQKVKSLFNDGKKTIGVLVHNNDELLLIQSMLSESGIPCRIILENERFEYKNLQEFFVLNDEITRLSGNSELSIDTLNEAYKKIETKFEGSTKIKFVQKAIEYFVTYEKNTHQAWADFLGELDDDFFNDSESRITLTTIHKAKGRQFDSVVVMDQKNKHNIKLDDALIRKYYVAITRPRHELYIFSNQKHFDDIFDTKDIVHDSNIYLEPKKLILYMGYADTKLSNSTKYQDAIKSCISGKDKLFNQKWFLRNKNNEDVCELSGMTPPFGNSGFQSRLYDLKSKGYEIQNITVDSIVFWEKEKLWQLFAKFEFYK